MLLAIDAGNTNVAFAVFLGSERKGHWRISADGRRTSDEYAVWLTSLMAMRGIAPSDISSAILSSVVPAATPDLVRLCVNHFNCIPIRVKDSGIDHGIEIMLDNPAEAGADRIANAVGGRSRYPLPLIVVDFGTATNFDVIDIHGRFIGGIITPGPMLALDALHRVAAQLPKVEIRCPPQVIGRSTVGAMESGMFWGYTAMVEGLILRMKAELSSTCDASITVIATGGLGKVFSDATTLIDGYDGDINLLGLQLIHDRNRYK